MAHPGHLKKLLEGEDVWHAWRGANPDIKPDLSGIKFQNKNINGAANNYNYVDYRYVSFNNSNLSGTAFCLVNFTECDFTKCNIKNCKFIDVDNLTQEMLDSAIGNANTKIPPYLMHPEHWFDGELDEYLIKSQRPGPDYDHLLNETILSAATHDFTMDKASGRVAPVAFDDMTAPPGEMTQDRADLLAALGRDAARIHAPNHLTNVGERLKTALTDYGAETANPAPNMRLLELDGAAIERALADDDQRGALSNWDIGALDHFVRLHNTLMKRFHPDALMKSLELRQTPLKKNFKPEAVGDAVQAAAQTMQENPLTAGETGALFDELRKVNERLAALAPSEPNREEQGVLARMSGTLVGRLTVQLLKWSARNVFNRVAGPLIDDLVANLRPVYEFFVSILPALPKVF